MQRRLGVISTKLCFNFEWILFPQKFDNLKHLSALFQLPRLQESVVRLNLETGFNSFFLVSPFFRSLKIRKKMSLRQDVSIGDILCENVSECKLNKMIDSQKMGKCQQE